MKKVLIAYFSLTGKTEKMAEYVAEGVRFAGCQATIKKIKTTHSDSLCSKQIGELKLVRERRGLARHCYNQSIPLPSVDFTSIVPPSSQ